MSAYIEAEVVRVIRTTLRTAGEGKQNSPVRRITEYWTEQGELLARFDPASLGDLTPELAAEILLLIGKVRTANTDAAEAEHIERLKEILTRP